MGFRFRKSINAGPLRFNFSKSGIGYSVGTKGLRYTKKAGGGTRTTASIPGTGISYVKDSGRKETKKRRNKLFIIIVVLLGILVLLGLLGIGSKTDEPSGAAAFYGADVIYAETNL